MRNFVFNDQSTGTYFVGTCRSVVSSISVALAKVNSEDCRSSDFAGLFEYCAIGVTPAIWQGSERLDSFISENIDSLDSYEMGETFGFLDPILLRLLQKQTLNSSHHHNSINEKPYSMNGFFLLLFEYVSAAVTISAPGVRTVRNCNAFCFCLFLCKRITWKNRARFHSVSSIQLVVFLMRLPHLEFSN